MRLKEYKSFTITELLIASVMAVILFTSAFGAFVTTKAIFAGSIEAAALQRDVNVVMQNIIRGKKENAKIMGLRSSKSFTIPAANPAGSEIDFTGTDDQVRKYFLSGNSIIYSNPTKFPVQTTIYTAPAGSSVSLRFWKPAGYLDNEMVGIYISVSKQANTGPISGSLSTYVILKNVKK